MVVTVTGQPSQGGGGRLPSERINEGQGEFIPRFLESSPLLCVVKGGGGQTPARLYLGITSLQEIGLIIHQ